MTATQAKVYVPQVPSRFDSASRLWIPSVNLEDAHRYGEEVVMLPPGANRLHIAPLAHALREKLATFGPEDHLVALGDPALIALSAILAARKVLAGGGSHLKMLKWDRITSRYISVEVPL